MADDTKVHSKSEEEEVKTDEVVDESDTSQEEGQMIPKSRLDKVIAQREEALEKMSVMEEKVSEIDSLKEEIEKLKSSKKSEGESFTEEETGALKKIKTGIKDEFMTREEFEEQKRIEQRESKIRTLSDKYKKGSGYPEFKADEILVYAKKNDFGSNLEAAYRDMHWEAIKQVLSKSGSEVEVPDSEKPTGGDRVKGTSVTTTQIANMDESEYEKNRGDIMTKFKNAIFGR